LKTNLLFTWVLLCFVNLAFSQTATVKGVILDAENQPVGGVNIIYGSEGTMSNLDGHFILSIPANQSITLTFSHVSFKPVYLTIELGPNEEFEFHPVLSESVEQIGEVVISTRKRKQIQGIVTIDPEVIVRIPAAQAGVENLLKSLPGVNNNNELSTQYSVRGGNYDENLVYVNEIEVYRPFLIRSGQQEGLSFVNMDLTAGVDFSAGGFQAKYGDKLSSVLDITYRRPSYFDVSIDASLLGVNVASGGISKNGRFTAIGGIRYRDNSLLVKSQETETNYKPVFVDAQTYLTYKVSNKIEIGFLGNISVNDYRYEPLTRQTNFGTITDPKALVIAYEGQEKDRYDTYFGALKTTYQVNENWTLKLIGSVYHTREKEHFDIYANYFIGEVNTDIGTGDIGNIEFSRAIGSQLTHARNDLDALIFNVEHKGDYLQNGHRIEYGLKFTHEDIRDRIQEYEIIDSAGFSIRPMDPEYGNHQPYDPYDAPLVPFEDVRAFNDAQINRFSGYVQWSKNIDLEVGDLYLNAGVRAHNWSVSGIGIQQNSQTVFSPRAQVTLKPHWEYTDMLFRLSGGVYHQPPFYRELRNREGAVVSDVKAQQSYHIVLGNEYSFDMWERAFNLTSEVYYKHLQDVNTYTLENVRIRYAADNNAVAYVYGLDLRLAGQFVPGTESWVSFGYMKTEENIDNRGYIFRPTDQRLKFGILFQDYVPKIPALRVYLNLVYNTGLPGGSPSYADPYDYQTRLRDYKRADVGFSYVIVDKDKRRQSGWLKPFKDFTIGFEIFNIFDVQNSITNTFVRDVDTKVQYAVPNYLTPRIFNLRTTMRF
jgi:hypothetical protein